MYDILLIISNFNYLSSTGSGQNYLEVNFQVTTEFKKTF